MRTAYVEIRSQHAVGTMHDYDLQATDSRVLREMADGLKADAKALYPHHKEEAMRLFHLFRAIVTELHRRRNPAIAYQYN